MNIKTIKTIAPKDRK